MNNLLSLQYFIPEIILLLNVFILFISSEIKQRRLIWIGKILLFASIGFVIILNLIRWFDRSVGLFYNSFAMDPFSNMFGVILPLFFLIFESRKIWNSGNADSILQKLIILTASILLVKANSVIGLFLCLGLIYIGHTIIFSEITQTTADKQRIKAVLTMQLLLFGLLFFGFSILYGFTGTLYFHNIAISLSTLSGSPLNYFFLTFLLIAGLGLFGIFLPFMFLYKENPQGIDAHYYGSSYFIPFLALFGILVRILHGFIPMIRCEGAVPVQYIYFILGLSICLITGANLYYFKRKTLSDLLIISLIIHYGLIIAGLAVFTIEALTASIYLSVSVTIILAGIIILENSKPNPPHFKLIKTVLYLGLIGIPGTSGFVGRYLLLRALYSAAVPLWLIVLIIVSAFPLIYFFTLEIIRLLQSQSASSPSIHFEYMPALLAIITILTGIYWEPLVRLIAKSLVFFN